MNQFEKDLSQGSVAKQLFLFAIPFIITNLVQSLYSVADMIIVGQFAGTVSMSGVNIGSQVSLLITMLVIGLSAGGTVLIAQYKGFGAREELTRTIGTLFSVLFVLAIVLTVVMFLFSVPILHLIQTPPEAFEESKRYLLVTVAGTIFIFGYNAFSAVFRGMGNSKLPLIFVSIACLANVFLDLLLVAFFKMGALGAAVATVSSQALSMILCIIFLRRSDFVFDFRLKSFRFHKEQLKKLLEIGIPTSIQNTITHASFIVLTAMVNTISVSASAGVGAVAKFNSFAILPAIAVGNSVSAMSAQNIGAGEEKRAVKTMNVGILLAFVMSLIMFVIATLFPEPILQIFGNDPDMIREGALYMQAFKYDFLIVPVLFCFNGLFIGSGHSTFSLINSILSSIIIRIPISYLFGMSMGQGVFGVGIGAPLATFVSSVIGLFYFLSDRWRQSTLLQR
ncbi:MAG: MATE family efflux transporter [Oscillospiraceae bacterium]|nr:MATE family efflux transporter [Oscillospiraceae bacterium]